MTNRLETTFNDARIQVRVRDNRRVYWRCESGNKMGKGRVRNISTSGMLLETKGDFLPSQKSHFSFDTNLGHENYIPQNGQLVWTKKRKIPGNKHLCGVKFVAPGEYVSGKLRQRIQKRLRRMVTARRLRTVLSGLLMIAMISLVVFVVKESGLIYQNLEKNSETLIDTSEQQAALTQSYASRYYTTQLRLESTLEELEATKFLYSESDRILSDVRTELNTTQTTLRETEQLLRLAQRELTALGNRASSGSGAAEAQLQQASSQIADIQKQSEARRIALEANIVELQLQNEELSREMAELEAQLAYLTGNIGNLEEGQALIKTYQDRMKFVQAKMKNFQREAQLVRKEAMNERDRIEFVLGNNGFLVRDGQIVTVDQKKYHNAFKQAQENIKAKQGHSPDAVQATSPSKVNIDVSFVD